MVPALRGCHTQAKSFDVVMKRVLEPFTKDYSHTFISKKRSDWVRRLRHSASISSQHSDFTLRSKWQWY